MGFSGKKISIICLLLLMATGGVVYAVNSGTSDSPLAHEGKMEGLADKWGDNMLLPTYLPSGYYLNDANVTTFNGVQHLTVNMDILSIDEEKSSKPTIDRLAFGQNNDETMEQLLQRVKSSNGKLGGPNEIKEIEPIKMGDTTGYWYKIDVHFSGAVQQKMDYIKDGVLVHLGAPATMSKDEFMKIATSFYQVAIKK